MTQEDPRPRRGDGSWLRAQGDLSSPRALHLLPPKTPSPSGTRPFLSLPQPCPAFSLCLESSEPLIPLRAP